MAEIEIHHEPDAHDPAGQKVGVQAAILAVFLAVVSIASHRTHTEAIIAKSSANDNWQRYQSTRVKVHTLEMGEELMAVLPSGSEARQSMRHQREREEEKGKEIQKEARAKEAETQHAEHRALRYDIGEGLLEIGLVLSSLYFIARKRLFPVGGLMAGIAGAAVALTGLLV